MDPAAQDHGPLAAVERLLAITECTDLMHEYGRRFDHGAGVAVADLFTEDGEWSSPAIVCRGRAELVAFFRRRDELIERVTRHVVTNVSVDVHSADRATARSVAIEYRGPRAADGPATETAPALVGDYDDEFRRVDGRWLFHRRAVSIAFKRPGEEYLRPIAE